MTPAWTRYFIHVVFAISQVLPLLMGGFLVGTAGLGAGGRAFSAERLIAGTAFLCSAVTILRAIRRRWQNGGQVGRSRALVVGVALLVLGLVVMMP